MARPRIFLSSTFYDLRHVREDLERFIREIGYEAVRNETGSIPYGKNEKLETAAYREVELCDILVSIIGGRFGADSIDDPGFSISQAELRRALERGIQVFIFIESGVLAEYSTYELNKANPEVKYRFVDNTKIYEFIEQVNGLPMNNPIAPFTTGADITEYLRSQWAGLFQRSLQQRARVTEVELVKELTTNVQTVRDLVTYLSKERIDRDEAIKGILLASHPAFRRFAEITDTPYRVFFTNRTELDQWLRAKGWKPVTEDSRDDDSVAEWVKGKKYMKLTHEIFDKNGALKPFSEQTWNPKWLAVDTVPEARNDASDR